MTPLLHVPALVWVATLVGLLAVLGGDLLVSRRADEPSTRQAVAGVATYVALAAGFGIGLLVIAGGPAATQFATGYVLEYSLSVDNLFVYLVLMNSFAVPAAQRSDVLLVGIVGTLMLRGPFILAGVAAAERFSFTFYIFGALLIYTAVGLLRASDSDEHDPADNVVVRLASRVLPVTDAYDGPRLTTVVDGRRLVTPLALAMVAVSVTGLVFALDSIPAIFGVTKDPYIIVAANAFALMGLRQLYFLVGGLVQRLVYLSQGLAVVLGFVGLKLVLEAAHASGANWAPLISIPVSLGFIVLVLAATAGLSLATTSQRG